MGDYKRLDLTSVKFSKIISTEEALKNVEPIELSEKVLNGNKKILATKAEKDVRNKCVKLEISY